jgi:hypothetical protein
MRDKNRKERERECKCKKGELKKRGGDERVNMRKRNEKE